MVIPRGHSFKFKIGGIILVSMLLFTNGRATGEDEAVLETLRRGIEYRSAVIRSISGSAVVEIIYSEDYNQERREEILAYQDQVAQKVSAEFGPDAARDIQSEVPELGKSEAAWIDFSYDLSEKKWREEVVALTNNGHQDAMWGINAGVAKNRDLPPGLFYWAMICDGEKIYCYDRSRQEAYIKTFTSESDLRGNARHYWQLQNSVVSGLDKTVLEGWRDGTYHTAYLGVHQIEPWGLCHEIVVILDFRHEVGVTKLLICPDLGFAVVRRTTMNIKWANPDSKTGPRLLTSYVAKGEDFAAIADGIWYPRRLRTDLFDYERGEGKDAWQISRVYRIIELRANESVQVITPYPFPFDTRVTDFSTEPSRLPQPRPDLPNGPGPPGLPEETLQDTLDLLAQVGE